MKKTKCTVLICICILLLGLSLTGCAQSAEAPKTAVGFVIAPTACSQGLNLASPLVEHTVEEAILNYGYICVVNADGKPEMVAGKDFDINDSYKSASKERLKMDAQSKTANFLKGMRQVIADDPEIDYMKSLQHCSRTLSSLEGYDNKMMIVVGTGLSTTGVLDFRNNLLMADPEAIADALENQGELPDLEGITVYWQQLGDTAPPQEDLNGQQRRALQEIWEAIIKRSGGTVKFDKMIYTEVSGDRKYPPVSTVELPAAPAIAFDAQVAQTEAVPFSEPVSLPEEQIRFIEDSDQYADEEAARKVLEPIAEILLDNPDVSVLLCGCIAGEPSTQTQKGLELSMKRAEAVKKTLMELSVPEEQLIAKGLGVQNPWHIKNLGFGELAAQNRRVVLLNLDTPLAQELLNR